MFLSITFTRAHGEVYISILIMCLYNHPVLQWLKYRLMKIRGLKAAVVVEHPEEGVFGDPN